MVITSKYAGTCGACSGQISVGDRINWRRGARPTHAGCADREPQTHVQQIAAQEIRRTGSGPRVWKVADAEQAHPTHSVQETLANRPCPVYAAVEQAQMLRVSIQALRAHGERDAAAALPEAVTALESALEEELDTLYRFHQEEVRSGAQSRCGIPACRRATGEECGACEDVEDGDAFGRYEAAQERAAYGRELAKDLRLAASTARPGRVDLVALARRIESR